MLGSRSSSVVLEAETAQVAVARRFVRRTLAGTVPDDVAADLQLIVSELFTNAVEHGDTEQVSVSVDVRPGTAEVTVDSRSPAPGVGPIESWVVADEESLSGRGLGIVRGLADVVRVEREPGRFVVVASRTYQPAGA